MSSRRKTKSSEQQLKTVKRLKRFVTTMEVIFGLLIVMMAVILFVPSVKTQVVKAMANTAIGQKIITWWGNNSYNESVRDLNFDDGSIKTNKLKYNYSEEYTNFVLFGVDSREGEVDASNSDSILIVSVHNTTGEVKWYQCIGILILEFTEKMEPFISTLRLIQPMQVVDLKRQLIHLT